MSEFLAWGLMSVIIFQQIFWSIQVHRMVDKLMSRNYHDYEASKALGIPKQDLKMPMDMAVEGFESLNDFRPLI